jgi:hypothetical protein
LKNVHQNGIYEFQFNIEITQLRNLEKLLNKPEEVGKEITQTNQKEEILGFTAFKLDNLKFCFVTLIFGSFISFLLIVVEIIYFLISK